MFTPEEQPLLTGSDEYIEEFVGSDLCMGVDWKSTEDEALDEAIRFLPAGSLTYETTHSDKNTECIRLRFRDREDSVTLPFQPQNNFRVLLRVWRLIQPEYDIKIFRCWNSSDTYAFLLRPAEWWTEYRAKYPQQYQKVFRDMADLEDLWHLGRKPWWKFW